MDCIKDFEKRKSTGNNIMPVQSELNISISQFTNSKIKEEIKILPSPNLAVNLQKKNKFFNEVK